VSLWRQLARGLRALTHRTAAERDVADEVQHYLEQARAANVARGLSPADALRAARLEVGNTTLVREQVRASGWENTVDSLLTDLRYAHAGARHRRDDGDLQRGEPDPLRAVAVPERGPHHDDLGDAKRRRA